MRPAVKRQAEWAIKPQAAAGPVEAELRAKRARFLAVRGVYTPVAYYEAESHALRYPWIEGRAGKLVWTSTGAGGRPARAEFLGRVLGSLVRLHHASPEGLELNALDPWRRIRPRMERLSHRPEQSAFQDMVAAVVDVLRARAPLNTETPGIVHGDFHLGQVIWAEDTGRMWILDLDDLAAGDPASDLGNLSAHLATLQPEVDVASAYDEAEALVTAAYPGQRGTGFFHRIRYHGAVALLRRALKGNEAGWPDRRVQTTLDAARDAASNNGGVR